MTGNTGSVFFVAGAFGGDYTRTFNVPAGKPLFVPVVNAIAFQTLESDTEASLRALAEPSNVLAMWATVNGTSLNPQLLNHRQKSPLFDLSSPLLADFGFCWNDSDKENCQILSPGVYQDGDAVSDGYWLMLEPLSLGQTYEVVVGGIFKDRDDPDNPAKYTELNIIANTSDRRNAGDQTRHAGQSQLLGVDRAGRTGVGIAPGVLALQAAITLDGVGDKAIAKYQRAIATPGIDTLAIDPDMLLLVNPDGGHRATGRGGRSPAGKCW
jgi:hypothetical protein